jgi:hypothetical protein
MRVACHDTPDKNEARGLKKRNSSVDFSANMNLPVVPACLFRMAPMWVLGFPLCVLFAGHLRQHLISFFSFSYSSKE